MLEDDVEDDLRIQRAHHRFIIAVMSAIGIFCATALAIGVASALGEPGPRSIWLYVALFIGLLATFASADVAAYHWGLGGRLSYESDRDAWEDYRERTSWLLLWFGPLGLHRFSAGHVRTGILQQLTLGGLFLWWEADLVRYLRGQFTDKDGRQLSSVGGENLTLRALRSSLGSALLVAPPVLIASGIAWLIKKLEPAPAVAESSGGRPTTPAAAPKHRRTLEIVAVIILLATAPLSAIAASMITESETALLLAMLPATAVAAGVGWWLKTWDALALAPAALGVGMWLTLIVPATMDYFSTKGDILDAMLSAVVQVFAMAFMLGVAPGALGGAAGTVARFWWERRHNQTGLHAAA